MVAVGQRASDAMSTLFLLLGFNSRNDALVGLDHVQFAAILHDLVRN